MPISWKSVLLTQRLSYINNNTSRIFFKEYTPESVSWGWPFKSPLTTAQLRKGYYESGMLGFQAEMNVIRVKLLENDKIIYQNSFPYTSKQISNIHWNVPKDKLVELLSSDNPDMRLESPIIDNLWFLLLQRGKNENGNSIGVYLKLAALPADITALRTKFRLESKKLKSDKCYEHTFSIDKNSWGVTSFAIWNPQK